MTGKLKILLGSTLAFLLLFSTVITAGAASTTKVMWGKIEVKKGVIGKVEVVKDTTLYKIEKNKLKPYKIVKKGTESAIYAVKNQFGTIYNMGSNIYYKKSPNIKYYVIPKDIAAKVNPPAITPDVSYLAQALPAVKFGMTRAEVEKALNQQFITHSGNSDIDGIMFIHNSKIYF